jgi:1,4-dihydroxy-2-naphthoate octaprenyltransferase
MDVLKQVKIWLKAMRAPFFQAVIIPSLLGTIIAWYHTGIFYSGYFLLTILGVVFVNAGTNLANDYFDHRSRADDINKNSTPFSGGSRVIQEGLVSPEKIHTASLIFFGLAILIGLYLVYTRGWALLIIGIIGVLSGYFYTASPVRIGYRGWGELLTGLNCGPLVVLGAYYVQAQSFSVEALVVSIPIGFLIAAILYINQFPDYICDKEAKKNTLIVKIGTERAIKGYYFLIFFPYVIIILGSLFGIIHWICLFSLLIFPLSWKSARIAAVNYNGGGRKLMRYLLVIV